MNRRFLFRSLFLRLFFVLVHLSHALLIRFAFCVFRFFFISRNQVLSNVTNSDLSITLKLTKNTDWFVHFPCLVVLVGWNRIHICHSAVAKTLISWFETELHYLFHALIVYVSEGRSIYSYRLFRLIDEIKTNNYLIIKY